MDLIPVPSGQDVTLIDVVEDRAGTDGTALRFRFLAPAITSIGFDAASDDLRALCEGYAMNHLTGTPSQIVISLSDRVVPFGESSPDATQYFEAFSLNDGHCIWEPF